MGPRVRGTPPRRPAEARPPAGGGRRVAHGPGWLLARRLAEPLASSSSSSTVGSRWGRWGLNQSTGSDQAQSANPSVTNTTFVEPSEPPGLLHPHPRATAAPRDPAAAAAAALRRAMLACRSAPVHANDVRARVYVGGLARRHAIGRPGGLCGSRPPAPHARPARAWMDGADGPDVAGWGRLGCEAGAASTIGPTSRVGLVSNQAEGVGCCWSGQGPRTAGTNT